MVRVGRVSDPTWRALEERGITPRLARSMLRRGSPTTRRACLKFFCAMKESAAGASNSGAHPALVAALEAQPAELNSAGLVTLAQLSEAARTRLFPELLERRLASVFALPRATVAAGPEAVAEYTAHLQRLLGDVDVVKTLCATSPYKPAFERAFSSAAAA